MKVVQLKLNIESGGGRFQFLISGVWLPSSGLEGCMQFVLVIGRLVFVGLIYLFIFRIFTTLLADLQQKGIFQRTINESGRLEVLTGSETLSRGRVYKLDAKGLRLGRGKHQDIVIPDHFASIEHSVLRMQQG